VSDAKASKNAHTEQMVSVTTNAACLHDSKHCVTMCQLNNGWGVVKTW
jgi:hypothetical protein